MPKLDRKDALWLAGLVLLVLVFFRPFVLNGRIPLNADWLHANFHPGSGYFPDMKPHNKELDDPIYQFYPLRLEAVRQWKSGHVPLWNPEILCGTPLLADGISKPFDPLIVFWFLFGGPIGHSLELMAQFLLMVTGMYVLARALGLSCSGAAVAAVVYAFNLLSVTWMELRTATGAFAFFPWAFLMLFVAFETRSLMYAALAGLFAAFMEFAGHPQFVFYGFAVLALYVAARSLGALRSRGPGASLATLALGAFALALAVALSAVETLPFLELVGHSARNQRQYETANLYSTPLSLITYVFPNFFGNPAREGYEGWRILMRPYMTATAGFVGIATPPFILASLFFARFSAKRFLVLVSFGVFLILVTAGIGLSQAASHFTFLFSGMDIARIVFISNFAFAILAGAGACALAEADWGDIRYKRFAVALVAAVAALLVVTACLRSAGPSLALFDRAQAEAFKWAMDNIERLAGNVFFWTPVWGRLRFLALAVGVALLSPWLKRLVPPAVFALIACELLLTGNYYNPFVRSSVIAPDFEALSVIKCSDGDGRILGVDPPDAEDLVGLKGDCLVPNTAMLYGLADIRGDESLRLLRYQNYILRIVGTDTNILAAIHMPVYDSPLIDALNVRYFLSAVPLAGAGIREVYSSPAHETFVYENLRALPRAYLVGNWRTARSPLVALRRMCEDASFVHAQDVVLENGGYPLPDPPGSVPAGDAVITEYSPSRVEIRTASSSPAVLVLADAYYHGWRATVDGGQTPVMPANGAVRAVFLPAGDHLVVFTYSPASFRIGAAVSIVAGVVFIAVLASHVSGTLRRKRGTAAA